MKKIFLTALSLVVLVSCKTDDQYEDYNRDPKNPTQVAAEFTYNAAVKSLFDQMTSTNVNTNIFRLLGQHWTETTYTDEANYDFTTRNIPQNHWSEMYRDVLLDLKTTKEIVADDAELTDAEKTARTAQAEILMIYTWQQLVDTFGDIPYTDALSDVTLPTYDDDTVIYENLIERINAVIPDISGSGFSDADKIYGGDAAAWSKFANSLKLRLGIRLTDVNPGLAQSTITSAVSAGVFTSNADNALLQYETATPNTNPLWVDLVQSGRSDFIAANTLVDIMNDLSDPRREVYFDQNLGAGVYVGGPYGENNSFPNYTHVGAAMHEPTTPGVLLDYAEVSFYLAEAAERSIVGTPADAEMYYNQAITASFDYWGADITGYLANPDVAYTTAAGDWRQKIGTQMWLAMYNRGFEAWTAWRKYDAPALNIAAISELPVPTRYTYPVNEQNLNQVNYEAASAAIGGDDQTTKVFWDTM
ncbi:SusD/RagB family nutrient-binding outer membrane lipoprotein [Gaetbulibacter sp. PBL-D1]|uniref:SusD/RagB family nutrient-binding outer membrane lipoprotein n=1 Tax=Gaetbulibacter sp. PBL-D1 TaxID=3422594 RepID=UPI003D2F1106